MCSAEDQKSVIVSSNERSEWIRRRRLQAPRSAPYSQADVVLARSVAYFSAGVRVRWLNQESTSATLADSGTVDGRSCAASHASGLPAARSEARAFWVKPVPKRLR